MRVVLPESMWADIPMFLIFSSSSTSGVPVVLEAFLRKGVCVREGRKEDEEKDGTRGEEERKREDIRVRAGPPTILCKRAFRPFGTPQARLDRTIAWSF